MSYRSLSILVVALSSAPIATAGAQTVYVAPGGVYVGAGPVYVTPAPQAVAPPYVAPYAPPPYAAPPYVAPAPTIGVAPGYPGYDVSPPVYGETGGVYVAPYDAYGLRRGAYVGRERSYGATADYAADRAPRPPAAVPYNRNTRCNYNGRWEFCR